MQSGDENKNSGQNPGEEFEGIDEDVLPTEAIMEQANLSIDPGAVAEFRRKYQTALPLIRYEEIKKHYSELKKKFGIDQLTEVYDRHGLFRQLGEIDKAIVKEKDRIARGLPERKHEKIDPVYLKNPYSVITIDIDNFKEVNSQYGHPGGNAVLRQLAQIFKDNTRHGALTMPDAVGRTGGDEFVVIAMATNGDAVGVAEKLRAAVARANFEVAPGKFIKVTCSFDVAPFGEGDFETGMLANSDRAAYRAKNSGKNRVCLFDAQVDFAQPKKAD